MEVDLVHWTTSISEPLWPCHEALLLHGRRWHEGWYLFQSRLSHPHANEGPQSLLRIEMLRTTIKNMTYVLIPQFTESQKSVTVHYPRHLYSVSPPFLIYAVVVQSQILSSHSLSSIPTRQIYLERFFDLVTNSDTVDYSWQIEKLKSWH